MGFEFFKSKFFITGGLILLALILIYLGQELKKRYLVQQEIKKLEQEIFQYEQKNKDFLELISYYKTQEFRERQARTILNLQKPGEFAIVLPGDPASPTSTLGESGGVARSRSNASKWWEYFFSSAPSPVPQERRD